MIKRKLKTEAAFSSSSFPSWPSEQEFTFRKDLLPSNSSPRVITRSQKMVELLPSSLEASEGQQLLLDQFKQEKREQDVRKQLSEKEWEFEPNKEGEEVRRKVESEKAELEARRAQQKSRRGKSIPLAVFQAGAATTAREGRTAAASQWGGRETPGSSSASATVTSPYFPTSPFALADEFIAAPSLSKRLASHMLELEGVDNDMGDCPLCGRSACGCFYSRRDSLLPDSFVGGKIPHTGNTRPSRTCVIQ